MAEIPDMTVEYKVEPQKWEYKVVYLYRDDESELNELGQDCWELVTIIQVSGEAPRAYLRRPIWDSK